MDLSNEFAAVRLELLDLGANGARLKISNIESGRFIYLDPFKIASLTATKLEYFDRSAKPG